MTTKVSTPATAAIAAPKTMTMAPPDAGAAKELARLNKENPGAGSISGKELAEAIVNGTKDPDNQAAGREYDTIKKWVKSHEKQLSPEAKKVFGVYEKECLKARACGQTGIDFRVYNQMQREMQAASKPGYKDATTQDALTKLADGNTKPGSISGKEMAEAIIGGTQDHDGHATTTEFGDVQKFVKENAQLLSPEAKKVFEVYAKQVKASGPKGIPDEAFSRMTRDMMRVATPGYQDKSAAAALNGLAAGNKEPGSISGKEMMDAVIKGTADLDGQAAKKEFADVAKFVKENEQLLSPEAKKVFDVYKKHVDSAKGGVMPLKDYMKMQGEMARVASPKYGDQSIANALNGLASTNKEPGSIGGTEFTKAVLNGIKDLDGHSTGAEFDAVAKFVKENHQLLSPEAKKAFATYARYVHTARAHGEVGLNPRQFARMSGEMQRVSTPTYGDKSAGEALKALAAGNTERGSISGDEMVDAVINGIKDIDNQSAGKEFADVAKFVKENGELLSPEAKKAFGVYEKYAKAAQAKGETGFAPNDLWRLQLEMRGAVNEGLPLISPNPNNAPAANDLSQLGQNPSGGSATGSQVAAGVANGLDDIANVFGNPSALFPGMPGFGDAVGQLAQLAGVLNGLESILGNGGQNVLGALNDVFGQLGDLGASPSGPLNLGDLVAELKKVLEQVLGGGAGPVVSFPDPGPNPNPGPIAPPMPTTPPTPGGWDGVFTPGEQKMVDSVRDPALKAQLQGKIRMLHEGKTTPIDGPPAGIKNAQVFDFTKPGMVGATEKGYLLDGELYVEKKGVYPGAKGSWVRVGEAKPEVKHDASAAGAVKDLLSKNTKPGSISGAEMTEAIIKGTADLDGQAAGREFNEFAKLVNEHGALLSPEAKKVFEVYEKHARGARSRGESGLSIAEYSQMQREMRAVSPPQYKDASAAEQLKALAKDNPKPGSISGKEMMDAIIKGTSDLDGQAAGKEFDDIAKFARENPQLLSPEAKKCFDVYKKHVDAARAQGQTGLDQRDFAAMEKELSAVAKPVYKDVSAAKSLEALAKGNPKPGSISGKEMTDAIISATKDPDNQGAGKEFADVAKFVRENQQLLSPEAKRAFGVYEKFAKDAQGKGQTGIDQRSFVRMQGEMRSVSSPHYQDVSTAAQLKSLAAGNTKPGSISGKEMMEAIKKGTADLDNQAAGKEFADVAKFVRENEQLLSPEAKRTFAAYEKFAKAAQAKGQTGLTQADSKALDAEMAKVSQPVFADRSAAKQVNGLLAHNTKPGSVSAQEMAKAILSGTADRDCQSAGKEFADFEKFKRENTQLLSPGAQKAFAIYEKYAKAAQAHGQTGIAEAEYAKMSRELQSLSFLGK